MQDDSTKPDESSPKWCPRCQSLKPPSEFGRHNGRPDGLASYCKPCNTAYSKERKRENPQKEWRHRQGARLRKYGLTLQQYEKMLWDQNGLCAICGNPHRKGEGNLHVDHDHKTGAVRALLCSFCNMGLGHFEDDVERLQAAIEYLKRHGTCN